MLTEIALKKAKQWLNTVLPQICHLCHAPAKHRLCSGCERQLPTLYNPCTICALPLTLANTTCAGCLRSPPRYDKAVCAYEFNNITSKLIHQFKDHSNIHWGYQLTTLLSNNISAIYKDKKPEAIIPVPLHWTRRVKRGYNQTEIIAHQLAKQLNIPVHKDLTKTKRSKKQQSLSRKERLKNLKGCFRVNKALTVNHVAIVDDVLTTGATAEILAKLLKEHGVNRVDIWCLARTPKNHH